jgi:Bacterial archaeo-eukaryotic release factor family 3
MIETKVSPVESLNLASIQELVRSPGPCITVLLPSYRPGAQAKSMAALLKTNLQEAARQLAVGKISDSDSAELLDPVRQLTQDEQFLAGSHWGRAIYRSPGTLRQIELVGTVRQTLTIGARFQVRPILAELHLPAEFYLLKLTQKRVDLLRCSHFRTEPVELPKGTPRTLDEALAFKQPDHDLENRSTAGASVGGMRGVRFGTGSGRETQQTYLADFYKAVDRSIRTLLNGRKAPLVLTGVDEDATLYRSVNTYQNLLAGNVAGDSASSDEEVYQSAHRIVLADNVEKSAAALAQARERMSPARFSVHLEAILHAAVEGRVDRIYIDEAAQRVGIFTDAQPAVHSHWGEEDLLNLAAVETLRNSGSAFPLPNSRMPDGTAVAAVFRY